MLKKERRAGSQARECWTVPPPVWPWAYQSQPTCSHTSKALSGIKIL